MSTDADRFREEALAEESLEGWKALRYAGMPDARALPVDPAVQVILDGWADGETDLPWSDAAGGDNQEISSEEKAS